MSESEAGQQGMPPDRHVSAARRKNTLHGPSHKKPRCRKTPARGVLNAFQFLFIPGGFYSRGFLFPVAFIPAGLYSWGLKTGSSLSGDIFSFQKGVFSR
jgi:hypothetical protein